MNHSPHSTGSRISVCFLLSISFFMLRPSAAAQLYTGSVTGVVTDASGAVISSAKLVLTDQEKGYSFNTTTDAAGRYLFRQVPPGKYKISVEAKGFQSQLKSGILLAVNENTSVDFSMKVGTVAEVLEVQGQGVQLETEDAVTGQVIDRRFINDLPLISRNFTDLAFLAPGVTEIGENTCPGCLANNFISNGSRNATADFLLDGVSITNFEQNSGILSPQYTPSVDAVEQFKVEQSNFSAEHGFSASTIVNIITRSGTNEFHGSAYEFLRNDKLDANDWFNNFNGVPRSPLRHNNFGATFGGPIRKNKTFFFVDYDGTRDRTFASANASVPSANMRKGDFGELCSLNGGTFDSTGVCSVQAGQLYDPYTSVADPNTGAISRSPIPFNNLASYPSPGNPALNGTAFQVANPGSAGNLIDPVAAKLIQLFPNPSKALASVGGLNWFGAGVNQGRNDQFDIKVDNRFSERSLLSVKYSQLNGYGHQFNCFGNFADACTQGPNDFTAHLFAINETYTFNPKLLLNISYGFTRSWELQHGIKGDFPNLDSVQQLGMPAYMDISGFPQLPAITIANYAAASTAAGVNIGTETFSYVKQGSDTHQLVGSISWVRGAHELKFGGEGRLHRINFGNPGWPAGIFHFDFSATSQNPLDATTGGDGMASFLMGMGPFTGTAPGVCSPTSCVYEVPNLVSTQSFQFASFVQDNYRATPKLTLNIGLRYELNFPRTERHNHMNWLDPTLVNPINGGTISYADPITGKNVTRPLLGVEVFASPGHRYNYDTDYRNIEPRFGFAYQLPRGLVVRGGYGIYFSIPRSGAAGTGPWGYQGYDQQTPWIPTFNNALLLPGARLSDPFPGTGPKRPVGNSLGALNDVGFTAVGPIPQISLRTPYEQTWSFGLQKQLPWKLVAEASYIGKKGTHLYFGGFRELNHVGPEIESLSPTQVQALATGSVANPFFGVITDPLSALSGQTIAPVQLLLPFPEFTSFAGDSPPIANSIYHAAQFRVEKAFSSGLQFLVTYTVSKSIDSASSTDDSVQFYGGGLPGGAIVPVQDPNNLKPERAVSTYDIPQVLQLSYVYALPFGRGKQFAGNLNPVLEALLGGWQTNGICRFDNGRPILPSVTNGVSIPTYNQRPNLTGTLRRDDNPQDWVSSDPNVGYFANPGVLQYPGAYMMGNAPRTITSIRQPGTRNVSLSLFKEFPLSRVREGARLEYRFEAFNAFNHPQFGSPDTAVNSSTFGKITTLVNHAREVQMALKLYF